jgi:hypothetical protein
LPAGCVKTNRPASSVVVDRPIGEASSATKARRTVSDSLLGDDVPLIWAVPVDGGSGGVGGAAAPQRSPPEDGD